MEDEPDTPEATAFMLATFADLYRQEVGAEEDVHRTLPFFGTALGIIIGALAYAAGRLPKLPELTTIAARAAFIVATALIVLAILEAICVLFWVSRAVARRDYLRIGPETELHARLLQLKEGYFQLGNAAERLDTELLRDMRQVLLNSYLATTPSNRILNQTRYRFRALASSHLVRSLIWALAATTIIFVSDKLGFLPKVAS